jgi:hypothetical protein
MATLYRDAETGELLALTGCIKAHHHEATPYNGGTLPAWEDTVTGTTEADALRKLGLRRVWRNAVRKVEKDVARTPVEPGPDPR